MKRKGLILSFIVLLSLTGCIGKTTQEYPVGNDVGSQIFDERYNRNTTEEASDTEASTENTTEVSTEQDGVVLLVNLGGLEGYVRTGISRAYEGIEYTDLINLTDTTILDMENYEMLSEEGQYELLSDIINMCYNYYTDENDFDNLIWVLGKQTGISRAELEKLILTEEEQAEQKPLIQDFHSLGIYGEGDYKSESRKYDDDSMEALALGKSDYAVTVVYVEGYDTAISCIADMSTQLGIDNPFASDYYQEDIGAYVWNVKTLMQEANPELGYTDGVFMLYDDGSLYLVSEINPYNVESVSLGKLYDNNLGYTAEDIQYLKRGVTTYEQR